MRFSSQDERDQYEEFVQGLQDKGYVKVEYGPTGDPYVVAQWNEGTCRMEWVAEYDDWMRSVIEDRETQLALAQSEMDGGA